MARTVGPLMSMEASGSIAGALTFSRWKGRPYVRQLVTPSNPNSVLQVSTRAMMRFLSQQWTPDVSLVEQATWDDLAKAGSFSPFNAYVKENLRRWTQFNAPGQSSPVLAAHTSPTFTTPPAATAGVRQTSFAWVVNALNAGWGLLIFQSATTGFTPARDNLVYAAPLGAGAGTALLTPMEPGTYFWNFQTFTDDGKKSASIGQVTGTVL